MYAKKRQSDGRVIITEHRLCPLCCKMINLNEEKYVQVWSQEWGMLYAHKKCQYDIFPKLKPPR